MKYLLAFLVIAGLVGIGGKIFFNNGKTVSLSNSTYKVYENPKNLYEESVEEGDPVAISAKIKMDMAYFRPWVVQFYDSHNNTYLGFCNEDKVKAIGNDFKKLNIEFTCRDTTQDYVAFAKLPNSEYWCTDSTLELYFNSIKQIPINNSCSE